MKIDTRGIAGALACAMVLAGLSRVEGLQTPSESKHVVVPAAKIVFEPIEGLCPESRGM